MRWVNLKLYIILTIVGLFIIYNADTSSILNFAGGYLSKGLKGSIDDLYQNYLNSYYDKEIIKLKTINEVMEKNYINLKNIYENTLNYIKISESNTKLLSPKTCVILITISTIVFLIQIIALYIPTYIFNKIPGSKFLKKYFSTPELNTKILETESNNILNSLDKSFNKFLNIDKWEKKITLAPIDFSFLKSNFKLTITNLPKYKIIQKNFIKILNHRLNYLTCKAELLRFNIIFVDYAQARITSHTYMYHIYNNYCKNKSLMFLEYTNNIEECFRLINLSYVNTIKSLEMHWNDIQKQLNFHDILKSESIDIKKLIVEEGQIKTEQIDLNTVNLDFIII